MEKMEQGFIILRHVNSEQTNQYWITCYDKIREFYPENKILLIDDNSNYDYVSKDKEATLTNTTIINTEFKGRGEILPYYYYLRNRLFDIAVIIHDSVFIQKHIDFGTENRFIWEFEHHWDHQDQTRLINLLKNNQKIVNLHNDKSSWKGCFGAMTVIKYDFLLRLENQYNFINLVNHITCRYDRMSWERVFAVLFTLENADKPSIFGNIHTFGNVGNVKLFGLTYNQHINGHFLIHTNHLPLVKIWSGR
jgi:hypothetical protein